MGELQPIVVEELRGLTVTVQVRLGWRVRLGLLLVRLGCRLAGMNYVDEFPMSLIQPKGEGPHGS